MSWARLERAWRSLLLVLIGMVSVILFSALLTLIVPDVVISFTENGEVTSRIHPGLFALSTTLGAGAAGAFIISLAEIADSMGGVAIAISLVPPLCVVGISLSQGKWLAASGALLLFLANFFAILFAGGITFMILGLGKVVQQEAQMRYRQRSFVLIILGTLLVTIPLCLTRYRSVTNTIAVNKTTTVVQEWLQDKTDRIMSVSVDGPPVSVSIEGPEQLGSVNELTAQLEKELGYPVTVSLHMIPIKIEVAQGRTSP